MRRLFAGAVCLLALCGCNSTPQNPVDAAIVNPAPSPPSPSGPPSRVAHQAHASASYSFPFRRDLQQRSKSTPTVV